MTIRTTFASLTTFAAVAALAVLPAAAQGDFPSRSLRMVVPFAAGGPTDVHARHFAAELSKNLGQQVVVENKAGAGGAIGAMEVVRSEPNGYTLLFSTASSYSLYNLMNPKNPQYDAIKDITPIVIAGAAPASFVAANKVPGDLKQVIEFAKANPGTLNYGSPGTGTFLHLAAERLKHVTGTQITHVPYRGSGPAMNDVVAGQISLAIDTLGTSLAQHRAGNARILAIATAKRSTLAPDIPTVAEALGIADFEAALWNGLGVRAGTPQPIVDKLTAAAAKVVQDPGVLAKLKDIGIEGSPHVTPDAARNFIIVEQARWKPIVEATGVAQN